MDPIHPRFQRRRDLAASLAIPAGLEGTLRKFARPREIAAIILSVGVVIAAVAALA
jgi:hypothetical protein